MFKKKLTKIFYLGLFITICILLSTQLIFEKSELNTKEELREIGGKEAHEFFAKMIRNPNTGEIPIQSLVKISNKMQVTARLARKRQSLMRTSTTTMRTFTNTPTWEERGGANIQGRLQCIMIDKRDATGNTLIVGSDTGGLWKTTNAMSDNPTWKALDDFMGFLQTHSVVQNPANLNEMYCSTGNIEWTSPETAGVGLYKSTDGGDTWNHLTATNNGDFKHSGSVVVNTTGDVFVATNEGGVQRSTDGGQTWTKVLGSGISNGTTNQMLDLDLATNGTLYATTKDKKIYKSTNDGNNWTNISIPGLTSTDYLIRLAVSPTNPNKVYAFVEWAKNFLTTDGGTTWNRTGDMSVNSYGDKDGCVTMTVDPNNDNRIYAGGINFNASNDSGATWNRITGPEAKFVRDVHVDQHAVTFFNSDTVFIGNDGGLYRTYNASSAIPDFTFIGNGLNTLQYYNIAIHPESGKNYFLGGTQDNATILSTGEGITTSKFILGGDGGFAFIDQDEPNIQLAAYQGEGGAYTTDSWESGSGGTTVGYAPVKSTYFITPKDYDDVNNTLYTCMSKPNQYSVTKGYGTSNNITYSIKTVTEINGGNTTCAMVSPNNKTNNTDFVYFGCNNGVIVKVTKPSSDTPLATKIMSGANGWMSSIAVEPGDENHIIATYSSFGVNHVVETKNGGTSWTDISNNFPDIPVYNGIFAPNDTHKFILATHLGVWITENLNGAATNWTSFNDGLANVIVRMVKARPSDGVVVAATHGRGLFTSKYFLKADLAPSTPTNVDATSINNTNITLTWDISNPTNDVPVTEYEVYDGKTLLTSVSTNGATIKGLSPNTTYSLTVKAKDNQGNISSPSSPVSITTLSTSSTFNIAIDASNVTTSLVSNGESLAAVNDGFTPLNSEDRSRGIYGNSSPDTTQWVQYDWSHNYKTSSIELYWYTNNEGILIPTEAYVEYFNGLKWIKISDVPLIANQFNTVTFNQTIETNKIRVSMKNTTQSTGIIEFRVMGQLLSENIAPSAPKTISANDITKNSLILTWSDATDNVAVTGYDVYKDKTLLTTVNTNTATITGLSSETSYSFTVKAKDGDGNTSNASPSILITTLVDYVVISDINFKNALLADKTINTRDDGGISVAEAKAYTGTINIPSTVKDFTGLEAFTDIVLVNINNSTFSGVIDLSANTKLTKILAYSASNISGIKGLKLLTNLISIEAPSTKLKNLDYSNNLNLERLYINNTGTTTLDLSKNTKLKYLDCSANQITSLDLSKNKSLTGGDSFVKCNNNALTSLNIANGGNSDLGTFVAEGNSSLTSIMVDCNLVINPIPSGWVKDDTASYDNTTSCKLSIDNLNSATEGKLYPNPATDVVYISSKNTTIKSVDIYTINGKLVKAITNNPTQVNLTDLSKGLYVFVMKTTKGRITRKLIKQ